MSLNSFPDGSKPSSFFTEGIIPEVPDTIYCVTDHGVQSNLSDQVQTQAIQAVIDLAASHGGGEIRFPAGHYRSGSLFFKQGTTLHLEKGALLQEYSGSFFKRLSGIFVTFRMIGVWHNLTPSVPMQDIVGIVLVDRSPKYFFCGLFYEQCRDNMTFLQRDQHFRFYSSILKNPPYCFEKPRKGRPLCITVCKRLKDAQLTDQTA